MKRKNNELISILLIVMLCMSCGVDNYSKNDESPCNKTDKLEYNELCYKKRDTVTLEELIHPNMDSLRMWENGEFLGRQKSNRDYKLLLNNYFDKDSLMAEDIEILYPTSVDEMTWFYSQLTTDDSSIRVYMTKIDDLMCFYAVNDSLSCLSRCLDMYFYMDPRVVDRNWIGEWNLERVQYCIIADNKESFKSYYDTLNPKYDWITKEWLYAYFNYGGVH